MTQKHIFITGGAGFVGANLAILLKKAHPEFKITALDNLHRRGSELNISRLKAADIQFIHGDIRIKEDIESVGHFDLLIECSAEPSVLAGYDQSPAYLYQTNLLGTLNCLEACRMQRADIIFLSTSRVYPIKKITELKFKEDKTRFQLKEAQKEGGISRAGLSEQFSLDGTRSLYGATKLCSELMIQEYLDAYQLSGIINRCGVLTGPWQMGKTDQGFVVLWVARHMWKKPLSYIGFNGTGKQVRDILHIHDLYELIEKQITKIKSFSGEIFNIGGGNRISVSLCELTNYCQKITGNRIPIQAIKKTRTADIPYYISDTSKAHSEFGWQPKKHVGVIVEDVYNWIKANEALLYPILN